MKTENSIHPGLILKSVYLDQSDITNILSLFILNRRKQFSNKEVQNMFNFSLYDTKAGQELLDEGEHKGILKTSRDSILDAITERFDYIPDEIANIIMDINKLPILKMLLKKACVVDSLEEFCNVVEDEVVLVNA